MLTPPDFVVSPDSVGSPVCREEAAKAAMTDKRILRTRHSRRARALAKANRESRQRPEPALDPAGTGVRTVLVMFVTKKREMLMELKAQVETLKTALVVMDPKVSTSAEAYEGLRKQVAVAASSRQAHLVQLAQFSRALRRGAGADRLRDLVEEWMQQAGLAAVTDPNPELYEILEGEAGVGKLEVHSPAYVDPQTRALVAMGQARWVQLPDETSAEPISTEPNDTTEEVLA